MFLTHSTLSFCLPTAFQCERDAVCIIYGVQEVTYSVATTARFYSYRRDNVRWTADTTLNVRTVLVPCACTDRMLS